MQKNKYSTPKIEVDLFECNDVLCSSSGDVIIPDGGDWSDFGNYTNNY